jgi:hypothetical protein
MMKSETPTRGVRGKRMATGAVVVLGAAMGVLWYRLSSHLAVEALLFSALGAVALLGGMIAFSRARSWARWAAAWEAYTAEESARRMPGRAYEGESLSLARMP